MFINIFQTITFIFLTSRHHILLFFVALSAAMSAQKTLRGKILETDSSTHLAFVFIINKSNGNGTVSDNEGNFTLSTNDSDTLVCSFVGYAKTSIPVKNLKTTSNGEVRIYMRQLPVNLNTITVSAFKIKPYEREYMNDIIDRSRMKLISSMNSPFTALYMKYSKEGKQVRKLAQIFEDLMIEEQVQQKLSPEILKRLTGDENIDYNQFRRYCYNLTSDYILSHDGFDLYSKVMDCYRRFRAEGH